MKNILNIPERKNKGLKNGEIVEYIRFKPLGNTPANNGGRCPKCGSKDIGSDNLNWWCNECDRNNNR